MTLEQYAELLAATNLSNADEVVSFIDSHEDRWYEVGETLTLPDIYQTYTVAAVRPFKKDRKFYVYLDLEAECAVDGCDNKLQCSVDVSLWRNKPHLTRCCPTHRYGFKTTMEGAWWTLEQRQAKLDELEAQLERRRQRRAALRNRKEDRIRRGRIGRAITEALHDLAIISDRPPDELLIAAAAAKLQRTGKKRDTRRQLVMRTLSVMRGRGLL